MRTTTLVTTAALAALATAALGACSTSTSDASGSSAYCKELKADKAYFQTFDSDNPDLTKLDEAFTRMHSLAASAPPAAAGDWKTVDTAFSTVQGALDEAGLNFGDLAAMQDGEIPDDVDLEALAALGPELEALSGEKLDAAAAAIDKHARKTCGFALEKS